MIRFTNMSSIWNDITKMVVLDAEITRGDIRFFSDKIDGNPPLFRGQRWWLHTATIGAIEEVIHKTSKEFLLVYNKTTDG